MFEGYVSRKGDATAEIESQNVLSAQAERLLDNEQFTVDGVWTLFWYVLEDLDELVTQPQYKTAHELYDGAHRTYGDSDLQPGNNETAFSRLVQTLREAERRMEKIERSCAN